MNHRCTLTVIALELHEKHPSKCSFAALIPQIMTKVVCLSINLSNKPLSHFKTPCLNRLQSMIGSCQVVVRSYNKNIKGHHSLQLASQIRKDTLYFILDPHQLA